MTLRPKACKISVIFKSAGPALLSFNRFAARLDKCKNYRLLSLKNRLLKSHKNLPTIFQKVGSVTPVHTPLATYQVIFIFTRSCNAMEVKHFNGELLQILH